ncbi:MAG: TIGR03936 family radical SAM-associated protein [Gemmataceae bacterium]
MVRVKYRIRFRKGSQLRLISHHDLMRCFERMLRRADLPFRTTEGFNPRPKMAFALSLGLGIEGCAEVVEMELFEELSADELLERLRRQAPLGLELDSCRQIEPRAAAQVRQMTYRVPLPNGDNDELRARAGALMTEEHCWIERSRPRPRRLDVRPALCRLDVQADALEMDVAVVQEGTPRPDEIMALLGLTGLLEQGAVLQRTKLELSDE